MLTSSILFSLYKPSVVPSNLPNKDIGIVSHIVEPVPKLGICYKKSSTNPNCLAVSATHIFVAQSDKAVVQVYDQERGTKEADVPFGERITSCCFVGFDDGGGVGVLVLGLKDGRLILWEVSDLNELGVELTLMGRSLLDGRYLLHQHIWKMSIAWPLIQQEISFSVDRRITMYMSGSWLS